jgi:hypothetical protein
MCCEPVMISLIPLPAFLRHTYCGFQISVWQSNNRVRSPQLYVALTPPTPGGRADRERYCATSVLQHCSSPPPSLPPQGGKEPLPTLVSRGRGGIARGVQPSRQSLTALMATYLVAYSLRQVNSGAEQIAPLTEDACYTHLRTASVTRLSSPDHLPWQG